MKKIMRLEKLSSSEHKQELLKLLEKTDAFLKKNNIKYFLASGTALGAVRHNGFIPWDDDIDLVVPRKDYEKLLECLREHKENNIRYFEIHDTKKYYYPFIKLYDGQVVLKERTAKSTIFLNIDIFPLDYIPDDPKKRKKIFATALRLKTFTFFKTNKIFYVPNRWKKRFIRFFSPILWIINIIVQPIFTRKFLIKKYNKLLKKVSVETGIMMNLVWSLDVKQSNDAKVFDEIIEINFEGKKYPIMRDYDAYLTALFGDYMKIPDEEDRIVHQMTSYRVCYDEK